MATKPTIHEGPPSNEKLVKAVREQMEEGEVDIGFEGSWNGQVTRKAMVTARPTQNRSAWAITVRTGDGAQSTAVVPTDEAEAKIIDVVTIINEDFRKRERKPN